jgi:heme/copper-type cytochrome/quinol oxidase subunit 2
VPEPERIRHVRLGAPDTRPQGRFSRWQPGPTAFGPAGRIAITALLALWVIWGLFNVFIVMWLVMVAVSGLILRDIWKRVWLPRETLVPDPDRVRPPTREEPPVEIVRPEIPLSTKVAWAVLGALVIGSFVVYENTSGDVRNGLVFTWLVSIVVVLLGWFLKG